MEASLASLQSWKCLFFMVQIRMVSSLFASDNYPVRNPLLLGGGGNRLGIGIVRLCLYY